MRAPTGICGKAFGREDCAGKKKEKKKKTVDCLYPELISSDF